MGRENSLLKSDINKLFLNFVVPTILGTLLNSMYILFDTLYIGRRIGELGLAALNISIPIFHILYGIGLLLGTGGAAIMAISTGQENKKGVEKSFNLAIKVGIILSIITTILGSIFKDKIIIFLGASEANIDYVTDYASILIYFSWSFIMVYTLAPIVRSDGAPKTAMLAMGTGSIVNTVLDYIFIYPLNMGMKGAAIGTVIASMTSLTILASHFIIGDTELKLKSFKLDLDLLRRITRTGIPSLIVEFSIGIVVYLFNKALLIQIGDIGVSAYGIITNISLMCTSIFNGLSQGIQPIIGVNYGANKKDRVKEVLTKSILISTMVGLIFLILGLLWPEILIGIFTNEKGELLEITKYGIGIYFYAFPLIGCNLVLAAFFQSIEETRFSTAISLSRGLITISISLELLSMVLGVTGIWLATPVAEGITLIIGVLGIIKLNNKLYKKGVEI